MSTIASFQILSFWADFETYGLLIGSLLAIMGVILILWLVRQIRRSQWGNGSNNDQLSQRKVGQFRKRSRLDKPTAVEPHDDQSYASYDLSDTLGASSATDESNLFDPNFHQILSGIEGLSETKEGAAKMKTGIDNNTDFDTNGDVEDSEDLAPEIIKEDLSDLFPSRPQRLDLNVVSQVNAPIGQTPKEIKPSSSADPDKSQFERYPLANQTIVESGNEVVAIKQQAWQIEEIGRQLAQAQHDLAQANQQVEKLASLQQTWEAEREGLNARIEQIDREQQDANRIAIELQTVQQISEQTQRQLAQAQHDLEQANQQVETLASLQQTWEAEREGLNARIEQIDREQQDANRIAIELQTIQQISEQTQRQLAQAQHDLAQANQQVEKLTSLQQTWETERDQLRADKHQLACDQTASFGKIQQMRELIGRLEEELADKDRLNQELQNEIHRLIEVAQKMDLLNRQSVNPEEVSPQVKRKFTKLYRAYQKERQKRKELEQKVERDSNWQNN